MHETDYWTPWLAIATSTYKYIVRRNCFNVVFVWVNRNELKYLMRVIPPRETERHQLQPRFSCSRSAAATWILEERKSSHTFRVVFIWTQLIYSVFDSECVRTLDDWLCMSVCVCKFGFINRNMFYAWECVQCFSVFFFLSYSFNLIIIIIGVAVCLHFFRITFSCVVFWLNTCYVYIVVAHTFRTPLMALSPKKRVIIILYVCIWRWCIYS